MTLQERSAVLDRQILDMVGKGTRVQQKRDTSAVAVSGRPVNHLLHFLLSVFTYGCWIPVWLLLAAFGGEHRHTVSVDAAGNVDHHSAPVTRRRIVLVVAATAAALTSLLLLGSCAVSVGSR